MPCARAPPRAACSLASGPGRGRQTEPCPAEGRSRGVRQPAATAAPGVVGGAPSQDTGRVAAGGVGTSPNRSRPCRQPLGKPDAWQPHGSGPRQTTMGWCPRRCCRAYGQATRIARLRCGACSRETAIRRIEEQAVRGRAGEGGIEVGCASSSARWTSHGRIRRRAVRWALATYENLPVMKKQTPVSSQLRISPISSKRAFESVEAQIRGFIASGSLLPGDRLPQEGPLAAILHLGAIGPDDLTEARIGIMDLVVRTACSRISEEQISELEANIDATSQAYSNEDFPAIVRLTSAFHILLAKSTRNAILLANVEGLQEIVRLFLAAIGPVDMVNVIPSRRRFLKHVRNRDADAASAEMARMLDRVQKNYFFRWKSRVTAPAEESSESRGLSAKEGE